MFMFIVFVVLALSLCASVYASVPRPTKAPHIVMFIIDDLGWTDVGYRNNSGVSTPVLDSLAASGVRLERSYFQPVCSPSRTSLLQGRFAFRKGQGLQHYSTIMPASTAAMRMEQPTLPEILKRHANYKTALVGKWHAGYAASNFSQTPTGRGFDSFLGYMQGEIGYYNHTFSVPHKFLPVINITGLDFWRNRTAALNVAGVYSKTLYDHEAARVLSDYTPSSSSPLFLYYAHQVAHVPLDLPPKRFFENCTNSDRRVYCAMLAAMDDSLRLLVAGLKSKGMWQDTILIVTTDNGGMPPVPGVFPASAGNNWPLRAGKGTVFEGGVRGVTFVNGGDNVLPARARGQVLTQPLVHVVDWLPTLAALAQVPGASLPSNLDGIDIWDVLVNNATKAHDSLPLNINYDILFPNNGYQVGILSNDGWKLVYTDVKGPVLDYDGWFNGTQQHVPAPPNPTPNKFLFNVRLDPNEYNNVYSTQPSQVAHMETILKGYMQDYQKPQPNWFHPLGVPELHKGVWAPFHTD